MKQPRSGFAAAGFLSRLLVLFLLRWAWLHASSTHKSSEAKDPFEAIRHGNETCQVTRIFPFLTGCPKRCKRAVSDDEPMYRMTLIWYFAGLTQAKGQAYDMGINYQCPDELVENFQMASKSMEMALSKRPGLHFKRQERMHLSLAYLCCLRRNETNWVREIMHEWVLDNYPFNLQVRFEKAECWRTRHNSAATIILADNTSQQILMKMNRDLEHRLLYKGIPTEVPRSHQMPFHLTLFSVFRGEQYDLARENSIAPDIPDLYHRVSKLSHRFGDQWTGKDHMDIHHTPTFTTVGKLHAGKS